MRRLLTKYLAWVRWGLNGGGREYRRREKDRCQFARVISVLQSEVTPNMTLYQNVQVRGPAIQSRTISFQSPTREHGPGAYGARDRVG